MQKPKIEFYQAQTLENQIKKHANWLDTMSMRRMLDAAIRQEWNATYGNQEFQNEYRIWFLEKRIATAEEYLTKEYFREKKKREKRETADSKRAIKQAEKEMARREKLPAECRNPDGSERMVDLFLTIQGGSKKIGSFSGRASLQIPAARRWAAFYAREHNVVVASCDYAGGKSIEVFNP